MRAEVRSARVGRRSGWLVNRHRLRVGSPRVRLSTSVLSGCFAIEFGGGDGGAVATESFEDFVCGFVPDERRRDRTSRPRGLCPPERTRLRTRRHAVVDSIPFAERASVSLAAKVSSPSAPLTGNHDAPASSGDDRNAKEYALRSAPASSSKESRSRYKWCLAPPGFAATEPLTPMLNAVRRCWPSSTAHSSLCFGGLKSAGVVSGPSESATIRRNCSPALAWRRFGAMPCPTVGRDYPSSLGEFLARRRTRRGMRLLR